MEPAPFFPWFLGPKAENADFVEEMLLYILRDYVHWRRNYFPGDRVLATKAARRATAAAYDQLESKLTDMSAELRRNFPFYSPRYIGHQLSEVSVPALLGMVAGLLYNPNNVTPEAAPVTVEWEIEACSAVLAMLGFNAPPAPPVDGKAASIAAYERRLRSEFGWAHITSGGTTANIEALWVARSVRYFTPAIKEAAAKAKVEVDVKLPNGDSKKIRRCSIPELLLIKPNEAIYLLGRLVDAIRIAKGWTAQEAATEALRLIREAKYSPAKGFFGLASEYPPLLYASGAAHYSVTKAADILGLGKDNVILLDTDAMFRIDVRDLETRLKRECQLRERIPLAVVAVAGTTEEGAVDPIHRICDIRASLESDNASFWLHIDAAWGGFFRTLLTPSPADSLASIIGRVGTKLQKPFTGDIRDWHRRVFREIDEQAPNADQSPVSVKTLSDDAPAAEDSPRASSAEQKVTQLADWLDSLLDVENPESYFKALYGSIKKHEKLLNAQELRREDFRLSLSDRLELLRADVSDTLRIELGQYQKDVNVVYGAEEVCSAFVAFPEADSITVDPHKMGYLPYPCGVVAFRNDRVRHFITQRAPYITSATSNVLIHHPPRHLTQDERGPRVSIDAFAPFILEGSKPGAAASALWLSTQLIPLNANGHGQIVKASILAARELYEWLKHWGKLSRHNGQDDEFEFVPYTAFPPDTNIVIFAVRKKTSRSLETLNALTNAVYDRFSIQAELGEREYSYSQPFFLTRTTFDATHYPFDSLAAFFERCDIRDAKNHYLHDGAVVLRATVMTPYITPLRKLGVQHIMREFMVELATTAREATRALRQ